MAKRLDHSMRTGDRIRAFRLAQRMTREDLARTTGIPRKSIVALENQARRPGRRSAAKLAAGLGCDVADLRPDLEEGR